MNEEVRLGVIAGVPCKCSRCDKRFCVSFYELREQALRGKSVKCPERGCGGDLERQEGGGA